VFNRFFGLYPLPILPTSSGPSLSYFSSCDVLEVFFPRPRLSPPHIPYKSLHFPPRLMFPVANSLPPPFVKITVYCFKIDILFSRSCYWGRALMLQAASSPPLTPPPITTLSFSPNTAVLPLFPLPFNKIRWQVTPPFRNPCPPPGFHLGSGI